MKFSKSWLNEITKIDVDIEKLTEQLTMVGLEVSQAHKVAPDFHGVVVGEVLEVSQHPNADKLRVCQVNVSAAENLNIVCGAANVRPKLKVPVALIGAALPNGFKIKKTKLRGVDSVGMLCSAVELGLPEDSSGILELSSDAPIGMDIRKYLGLDDWVGEIDLTTNRGDCLSMLGIAREVMAINRVPLTAQKIYSSEVVSGNNETLPIIIDAKDSCPHYCGCIIRGINNRVQTPFWIQERLRRLGQRPINLVVDITNYVMLELGQPLHAFELSKIDKKINVRYAKAEENITLLDGQTAALNDRTLVIADNTKCIAIAGVIGGNQTIVSDDTTDIFLESAFFVPEKLAGVARHYNLQTDSSYRFERGVDYALQLQALNRATSLIIEIAGGVAGAISEETAGEYLPKVPKVMLRRESIKNILGFVVDDKDIVDILSCLGMTLKSNTDSWEVSIPSWRFDIKIEEDLVEEVARIYGYHQVPEEEIFVGLDVNHDIAADYGKRRRLYYLMEDLGYHEVISYSFVDEKLQALLDPDQKPLKLSNPISSEMSVMRTSLWPGLLNAVKYNSQRQQQRARFFEVGLKFLTNKSGVDQLLSIAGITFGNLYSEQWGLKQEKSADFFDLKNDVTYVLKLLGGYRDIIYKQKPHPALHPLRAAQIYVADICLGYLGELHPSIMQKFELTKPVYLFEIDLYKLIKGIDHKFKTFSKFPRVVRDIAITVSKDVTWAQIKQKIVDISGDLLQNITLFDLYWSENIGLDKHSMAIHLAFQSISRTLVDSDVESLVDRIVLVLKQTFNASLRG